MTGRLSDVESRIGSVDQLAAVIGAMRGIAAVKARDARGKLGGIRAYADTVAGAIGAALALLPAPLHSQAQTGSGHAIVAFCAEQGFAGAFNSHVLGRVQAEMATLGSGTELLLLGTRGLVAAAERGLAVAWSAPMVTSTAGVAAVANRIVEILYQWLDAGRVGAVTVVRAEPAADGAEVVAHRLVPFDFTRFPAVAGATAPLLNLPPGRLLERITAEYIFAAFCEAAMLSYAAENESRMRAMIAARANVAKTLEGLRAQARQLRQEEITSEIIELAAGTAASR